MGSGNWIVDNLNSALEMWNGRLAEIWQLISTSPESFKGGGVWNVIVNINDGLKAVGYALLVLFFVIGFVLSQILFMGENAFNPDYLTFDIEGVLINIVAPLIIVIIADVLLVGQLKTANEATNADCYCGELDLTEKHDTFSHTETTVVMKDNKDD